MKHLLLTTIAAVLLVGCRPQPPDISIHLATTLGNIKPVKQHIAVGTDLNAKDAAGNTPLNLSIMFNHTETADLLRKHGGKTAEELRSGMTPLHIAAKEGKKETIELLIAKGADVNAKVASGSNKDKTPFDLAITRKHTEIADLLLHG